MRSTHIVSAPILALALAGCHAHSGIQQADLSFEPSIPQPAYSAADGPVVQIDEAHFNFHTVDERYAPFAKLLRRDGYEVQGLAESATPDRLAKGKIYVIANAIAESDQKGWKLPAEPAFTRPEIEAIRDWVEAGGSLFLIADHMPFPGSVEDLAAEFDILFGNGFLYDSEDNSKLEFTRDAGLAEHPITEGRDASERVDSVRTFTGQAFRVQRDADPLLTIPPGSVLRLPSKSWKFKPTTPSIPAEGMLQGAVLHFGKGRVAVFGEAAMFSAQEWLTKDERVLRGMNRPDATQNPQFLLNVMHWLSGLIE
ncbi:MAG: DUF4350 domain-containing protein [Thermoanaerobaculia bacterium]